MIMNETTAKICEEQVADLTIENAHRVTMIRKKGTDYPPVPFLFRKEHHGMSNYTHLYGNPEERNELHSRDVKFSALLFLKGFPVFTLSKHVSILN